MPADPGAVLTPEAMQLALRRRLRLPLPLTYRRCGDGTGHGCGAAVDAFKDHYAAWTRTGFLARRAAVLEQAWARCPRGGRPAALASSHDCLGSRGWRLEMLGPRRVWGHGTATPHWCPACRRMEYRIEPEAVNKEPK